MLRNLIVFVVLAAASSAYLWASPSLMPTAHAFTVIVNLIAVPFVLGLLAGYLLTGRLVFKLLGLLLIPIAHVLILGGDPAKPGLENVVALAELPSLWIGCLLSHVFQKKLQSTAARNGTAI